MLAALSFMLLPQCSKTVSPEVAASEAARQSYGHLLAGRYDQFLAARDGMDTISSAYHEQLVTAYKQFVAQQRNAHGGINTFHVSRAAWMESPVDSTLRLMQVFLVLHYADHTEEEIVVPMVERNGVWKIK